MTVLSKVLQDVAITFKGMSDSVRFKSISKESLVAQVEDTKTQLTSIQGTIFSMNKSVLESAFSKAVLLCKTDRDTISNMTKESRDVLPAIESRLAGVSRKMKFGVFGPMSFTSKICIKNLVEILDNAETAISAKSGFVVGETRVTQGVVLGVLETAKMFSRYNMYMIATISHITAGTVKQMPNYMTKYLVQNVDNYVSVVNSICSSTGKHSVMNDIAGIKKSGLDLRMYSDKTTNVALQSRMLTEVLGIENIFVTMFNIAIMPIALIGEVYIDMRHSYYADMADQKKWLEMHIASMRLNMSDKPHGIEANKAHKAISYYEDRVAKIDKKLDEYYNA